MSAIVVERSPDTVLFYTKHCPKCGGELDAEGRCVDCLYSDETSLTPEEARDCTCAGD